MLDNDMCFSEIFDDHFSLKLKETIHDVKYIHVYDKS